jgi:hypothetical protein
MVRSALVGEKSGEIRRRGSEYLWLCLSASAVTFVGFWFTYFSPMLGGRYPEVSPTVHLHGWTFFAWYLLLPLQAGLVKSRHVAVHRKLGYSSVVLAVAMTVTGLVVMGVQMELARQPGGSPFWVALGPGVFVTLVLFAVFYSLAIRFRRKREVHKRFVLLASAGGLGAAGFRIVSQIIGPGFAAGVIGILLPNLIVVTAVVLELRRDKRIHPVYRWGLSLSIAAEVGVILLTPHLPGEALSVSLAWAGRLLAPLY